MTRDGIKVTSLPVHVRQGAACITATIRLRLQVGIGLQFHGEGFVIESGAFWDPLLYKVCLIHSEPEVNPCLLRSTEDWYEAIGVYARAVEKINWLELAVGPTVVTTYKSGPVSSQCLTSSATTTSSADKMVITTSASHAQQITSSAERSMPTVAKNPLHSTRASL